MSQNDAKMVLFLPFLPVSRNRSASGSSHPESALKNGLYRRSMFLAMNSTLAGRSASRRMKYGYHARPNGTYTRTL